jgi:hypothetical protein
VVSISPILASKSVMKRFQIDGSFSGVSDLFAAAQISVGLPSLRRRSRFFAARSSRYKAKARPAFPARSRHHFYQGVRFVPERTPGLLSLGRPKSSCR